MPADAVPIGVRLESDPNDVGTGITRPTPKEKRLPGVNRGVVVPPFALQSWCGSLHGNCPVHAWVVRALIGVGSRGRE